MPTRLHPKLAAKYYGPFLVVAVVGSVAFKLQLPDAARIHPMFHVSQLELAVGLHEIQPECRNSCKDRREVVIKQRSWIDGSEPSKEQTFRRS